MDIVSRTRPEGSSRIWHLFFYAIVIIQSVYLSYYGWKNYQSVQVWGARSIIALTLPLAVFYVLPSFVSTMRHSRVMRLIVIFVLWYLLAWGGLLWAGADIEFFEPNIIAGPLLLLVGIGIKTSERQTIRALNVYSWMLLAAMTSVYFGYGIAQQGFDSGYLFATFHYNKNTMGISILILCTIRLALYARRKTLSNLLLLLFFTAAIVINQYIFAIGILGLIVLLFILFTPYFPRFKKMAITALLLAAILAIPAINQISLPTELNQLLSYEGLNKISHGRLALIREGYAYLKDHLLTGRAINDTWRTNLFRWNPYMPVHSMPLHILVANGLIGGIPCVGIFFTLLIYCIKQLRVRRKYTPFDFAIYPFFAIVLLGFAEIIYPFSPMVGIVPAWLLFGMYIGAKTDADRETRQQGYAESAASKPPLETPPSTTP